MWSEGWGYMQKIQLFVSGGTEVAADRRRGRKKPMTILMSWLDFIHSSLFVFLSFFGGSGHGFGACKRKLSALDSSLDSLGFSIRLRFAVRGFLAD